MRKRVRSRRSSRKSRKRSEKIREKWEKEKEFTQAEWSVKMRLRTLFPDWTKIPVRKLAEEESERLLKLESILHERVVGQEEAVIRRGEVRSAVVVSD